MTSQNRGRKQQQQLSFEPIAAESSTSPGQGPSPARVRFSSPNVASPNSHSVRPFKMAKGRKPQQQTLESSLGAGKAQKSKKQSSAVDSSQSLPFSIGNNVQTRQQAAPCPPPSTFMSGFKTVPRRGVINSDSESSVEEDGGVTDGDGEGPLKSETPKNRRRRTTVISSGSEHEQSASKGKGNRGEAGIFGSSQSLPNQAAADDDSDDLPLVTPRSSMPRRRQVVALDSDDEEEEEDIQTPAKKRKLTRAKKALADLESASDASGTPRARSKGTAKAKTKDQTSSPSVPRTAPRRHRTQKEKKMELLRRRRAGEKDLTIEDLDTSDEGDEEGHGALYDTDPELEVLDVFYDESEPDPEPEEAPVKKKSKATGKKTAKAAKHGGDEDANGSDGSLNDFIDNNDDTLGVPDEALYTMPLQFTINARKPLKSHFEDAIEWLVSRRLNPAFDRGNEVYVTAWRKLDDEVTGLANSKFVSSVWRPDFHKALKARPYMDQKEIAGAIPAADLASCQACGRSNHPATWSITFNGKPYNSKTLDEIDSDSEDEEDEERDADGNVIPPEDREFFVGNTCNSNAGTAHNLIHWKHCLRDWVDNRLEMDGWLQPDKLVERERMKPKKRQKLVVQLVKSWEETNIVKGLFDEFKRNIETARTKDTTKSSRGRR